MNNKKNNKLINRAFRTGDTSILPRELKLLLVFFKTLSFADIIGHPASNIDDFRLSSEGMELADMVLQDGFIPTQQELEKFFRDNYGLEAETGWYRGVYGGVN